MEFKRELQRQTTTAGLIRNFVTNTTKVGRENCTPSNLRNRLALLESYWTKFCNGHDALVVADEFPSSTYAMEETYLQIEEAYIQAKTKLQLMLEEMAAAEPQASRAPSATQKSVGKLPIAQLPKFSGDYLQWESFKDLFTSLVHNATDISDAERLQYLKTSLTGDAARIISNVKITDANYMGAWKALEDRYDNKRLLLHHYFRSFMALKPMTSNSVMALQTLFDSTQEIRRSLENLGRPVSEWDDWFVYLTVQRLHIPLQREWETTLGDGKHIPSFKELEKFLTNRLQSMSVTSSPQNQLPSTEVPSTSARHRKVRLHLAKAQPSSPTQTCRLCRHNHQIYYCAEFKRKSVTQRKELVTQWQLCTNCLRTHPGANCPSTRRCLHCGAEHHTLLHDEDHTTSTTTPSSLSCAHALGELPQTRQCTLLATAIVKVTSSSGQTALARALLDQGSEATFISEDLAQRLRLPRTKVTIPVVGIGATTCSRATAIVQFHLSSPDEQDSFSLAAQAFVLPRLTRAIRPSESNLASWPHLRHLKLADTIFRWPSRIDLIIGADIYGQVLLDGLIKGPPGAPIAQQTVFGWVLSGRLDTSSSYPQTLSLKSLHCAVDISLAEDLRRFWEIEEPVSRKLLSPEEEACEEHFRSTHSRGPDGRFIVRLPRRSHIALGSSRPFALRTFQRSEQRRLRDEDLNQAYKLFMQEYIELGHMTPAPASSSSSCYYLPHHAVWKSEGLSQKIRVVFNASARTSSGNSLNDTLLTGPKLQQDIRDVLTTWRKHPVVFTADIVKMFRQIWVNPEDRDLQRILWRDEPGRELQEFQLNTVTYGTACAPYLAIRCLQQLASDEATRFPKAAEILQTQTYVDDILAGADSPEAAIQLKAELQRLLMAGGFQLAKWASNSPELAEVDQNSHFLADGSVKTLGLQWNPSADTFGFKVVLDDCSQLTKRTILSRTAKLFDPLGWLAPVLVKAKMFLQDIWTIRSGWDDALPTSLEIAWTQYYRSLIQLQDIQLPRWISLQANCTWEIHGFCDASTRAYAAAVYVRILLPDGTFRSNLLMAKTKVAPLKVISLPRLELCGAVLLAKLLQHTTELFPGTSKVYAWTDSQVVLCWLRSHPSRWKCFVANRTSEIHQLTPNAIWNHVTSEDNPADPASRGIDAGILSRHDLWWHGPSWLSEPPNKWPRSAPTQSLTDVQSEENPRILALTTRCTEPFTLQDRYSSLTRLLRITAWIHRFGHNSRATPEERISGPLQALEISSALKSWIRFCQSEAYSAEIQALSRNQVISNGSPLLALRPFLDSEGLLRVGGRLEHSALEYNERHPHIIPPKCHFSRLLILDAHHRTLHGGPQLTLSHLSRRFWIIHGRRQVQGIIRNCVRCLRYSAKVKPPIMGQLPANRVTPSRPFHHTGLDYAGPLQLRTHKGRGCRSLKGYIALFVCMATKAIHLEAVTDCTTPGFLAAFKRFCARRGIPAALYSDQATNFRGADASLRSQLQIAFQESPQLADLLANDGTEWKFIPPHTPHFGGIWEAGVRSVKFHLRRVIGDHTLTYEELSTLLAEIEACLNSRPIIPIGSSPDDLAALTPGHFLIGTALKTIPEPSLLNVAENRLSRWQLLRRLYEEFWKRWSSEYVHQLQKLSKWRAESPSLQVNDLVLIKDDHLPPAKWRLGRITQVHPGSDGIIRVVSLRTATTEIKRPVVKLCPLPVNQQSP